MSYVPCRQVRLRGYGGCGCRGVVIRWLAIRSSSPSQGAERRMVGVVGLLRPGDGAWPFGRCTWECAACRFALEPNGFSSPPEQREADLEFSSRL